MRLLPSKYTLQGLLALVLLGLLWVLSSLGPLRTFLPHAFSLLGWPGTERTYLILLQNDAELRPTGGFITAFAILELRHGFPIEFSLQDVYGTIDDHAYVSPPYPLDELLEKDSETYIGHSFRDANLNPDFPQAAEDVLSFFYRTYPDKPVDGVFAVNFSVLEDILALYEPLSVDHYELTKDNLFETLETAVSDIDRHNLEALASRKEILKTFAGELSERMLLHFWQWRALSEVVTQSLNGKDILLSFENETLADKMKALKWDGSLPENPVENGRDVLVVNLANYGGMKSNRYVTQTVFYTVEITQERDENGDPILYSDLEIRLTHHGDYSTPLSGVHKGYLRVFLPEGATLLESSIGVSTPETIDGYTGWGDFVYLYPGETSIYTYRFQLNPALYQNDRYALTVIKQPGTHDNLYEVTIRSPLGRNLLSNDGDVRENVLLFRAPLERDETLNALVLPDESAPRLYDHTVAGLNVIKLSFAEDVDSESAEDALNYELTDLNINEPETTDTLTIDFIKVEGGTVLLYTHGMTLQPDEHYRVLLRNLRDTSGNLITPNPRTVTVVQ